MESNWAWFAGVFEGEGTIAIYKAKSNKTGTYNVDLRVSMTDLDVLEGLQKVAGGSIAPPRMHKLSSKPCWTWGLYSVVPVHKAICSMLPYLRERRRARAKEALSILWAKKKIKALLE